MCALGLDVAVAGGIHYDILPLLSGIPIYGVVVGRGIAAQTDPAAAAKKSQNASARSGAPEMTEICASLLAADYARLGEEMQRAETAGADSFHFDMMDGHYVPNLALTPDHLKALRPYSHLPFHAHLELNNPDDVLFKFEPIQANTTIVQWNTLLIRPRI
jgi:hypothetical protein